MIRKYTAAIMLASAILLLPVQACSRASDKDAGSASPDSKSTTARPEKTEAPPQAPSRPPRTPSAPDIRALPVDKFIGSRPLDRIVPEDYTLGPLQDLSNLVPGSARSAADAVQGFLEGLREGRLTKAAPGARDILEFLLAEILTGEIHVTRWKMGSGIQRPEGGFSFPVLLETDTGRTTGEILVLHTPESGWLIELAILDTESLRTPRSGTPEAFDPTIRTVKRTGR